MSRSLFWLVTIGIVSIASLSAYYLWLSNNRFYIVTGPNGLAYQIDMRTGETRVILGKKKVHNNVKIEPLPSLSLIKGFARVNSYSWGGSDSCRLSGEIYNGSKDWFLAFIEGTVRAGRGSNGEGEVWESSFTVDFADGIAIVDWGVKPLEKESFNADLFGCPKDYTGEFEWSIDNAYGYPAEKLLFLGQD